jgi:hypothetical protein
MPEYDGPGAGWVHVSNGDGVGPEFVAYSDGKGGLNYWKPAEPAPMWSVWQVGEGRDVTYYVRTPVGWIVTWKEPFYGQKTMNATIANDVPPDHMTRVQLHNPEQ